MQITVSGKQVELSDALRTRVSEQLDTDRRQIFRPCAGSARHLQPGAQLFHLRHQFHAGRGLTLRGEGEAADAHSAFDDAAEHIAKRLRRYRRRVNEHARDMANRARPEAARQYVLRQEEEALAGDGDGRSPAPAYATVIAESPTEIACCRWARRSCAWTWRTSRC